MQILELHLKNFGKFTDRHLYFPEQIQVIYGENEYGKSTIYAFIKAMLFGLERGRGRAAGRDEFSRYEPWENPNYYAGAMRFRCGGRTFCLERTFDRYTRSASLVCEDDGEELSIEAGDLEMLLGGITRASFENTAAIGQLTAKPGQELASELKNYAANYYGTGSGEVDLQHALEQLRLRKKQTEQEEKGYLEKQQKQLDALEQRRRYVELELEQRKKELAEVEKKFAAAEEQRNAAGKPGEKVPQNSGGMGYTVTGWILVLCAAGGIFLREFGQQRNLPWGILVVLLAVGAVLTVCGGILKKRGFRKRAAEPSVTELAAETGEACLDGSIQRQKFAWESARIREEIQEKQMQSENLREQILEVEEDDTGLQMLQKKRRALELAEVRMKEAAKELAQGFGERLDREASEILEQITEGRYSRLLIDEKLDMAVLCGGRRIPVERLSRGTIEQIYFSLRMAVLDLLYEEEIPVILDDAFVFYDEKRLNSVLKWLSEQSRQVIIFSCQIREKQRLLSLKKWKDEIR